MVAMVPCGFAQHSLPPHNKVSWNTFVRTYRATALCLGCGKAGKGELRASKYNHTLPASAPSFSAPTQRRTNLVRGFVR